MSRSLIDIAADNERTLNRIRDLLDPHRRMGESDEEVLERLVKNRIPTGDIWQRAGINTVSLVYQGDEIDTILAVHRGKEIRFVRGSRPVSDAERQHAREQGERARGTDLSANFVSSVASEVRKDWLDGWMAEDRRIREKGWSVPVWQNATPTGVAPSRIGDILVDAAGNREMVTTEGDRVNSRMTPHPDGTVTLAPGVRVERKA